jgi:hypothetical protein
LWVREVERMSVSSQFPDGDYIPFSEDFIHYDTIQLYNFNTMKDLIDADFWGLYIRRADGSVEPIYNAYPYSDAPKEAPQWLNDIRNRLEDEWETILSRVNIGDTLALLMFNDKGWGVYATRVEGGWHHEYRHHTDY